MEETPPPPTGGHPTSTSTICTALLAHNCAILSFSVLAGLIEALIGAPAAGPPSRQRRAEDIRGPRGPSEPKKKKILLWRRRSPTLTGSVAYEISDVPASQEEKMVFVRQNKLKAYQIWRNRFGC